MALSIEDEVGVALEEQREFHFKRLDSKFSPKSEFKRLVLVLNHNLTGARDSESGDDTSILSDEAESDRDSSSGSEIAPANPVQPYRLLLESLQVKPANGRPIKRRRLTRPILEEDGGEDAVDRFGEESSVAEEEKDLILFDAADAPSDDHKDEEDQLDSDNEFENQGML